jgi:hypothetical protein
MELGPRIGRGRTAEIHAWGDGQIVKLFHPGVPDEWIRHELQVAQRVVAAGLSAPRIEQYPAHAAWADRAGLDDRHPRQSRRRRRAYRASLSGQECATRRRPGAASGPSGRTAAFLPPLPARLSPAAAHPRARNRGLDSNHGGGPAKRGDRAGRGLPCCAGGARLTTILTTSRALCGPYTLASAMSSEAGPKRLAVGALSGTLPLLRPSGPQRAA